MMKRTYWIAVFFPFVLTNSCTQELSIQNSVATELPSKRQMFPKIAAETDLQKLTDQIAEKNCVYERAVGEAGAYTEVYACYERLCIIASDKELVQLIDHASPAVRVYALRALKERQSESYEAARLKLATDESKTDWFSGCMRSTQTVSFFVKTD